MPFRFTAESAEDAEEDLINMLLLIYSIRLCVLRSLCGETEV